MRDYSSSELGILPIVRRLFGSRPHEDSARALYAGIVAQARRPEFFIACGVPDTVDGRFDLLVLHVFLVMHRLKQDRAATADLSQALVDVFFQDLDESLRELGAGDMGIGRRIKAMAEGFYGRTLAYERSLEQGADALEVCVRRNLYGAGESGPEQLRAVALYITDEVAALAVQDLACLSRGEVLFGPPPQPAPAGSAGRQRR
ncbi:MAG TPA: ubiquinol-cytochrome C chaperone family protein [Kiloniellales bacterium]